MIMTDARPTLAPGLRHQAEMVVAPRNTVPKIEETWSGFEDMPPVFATAMMIGFIEQTCVLALAPFLSPGQHTVGTHVDVSHIAATPVGMRVTSEVELIEVAGPSLLFRVTCRDEAGTIGEGLHRRAIIDHDRFMRRLEAKAANRG